jgi:hypothetical protein
MRVHLRFLRQSEMFQEVLEKDGWQLEPERGDSVTARHPLVVDETAARNRLQDLGLLTTASLAIHFIPTGRASIGRQ